MAIPQYGSFTEWLEDELDEWTTKQEEPTVTDKKLTVVDALAIAIQAGVPTLVWGPPGAGKSRTMETLNKQLDRHLETVIASLSEPTDFAGIPYVHNGEVIRGAPAWAKRLAKLPQGTLFLDEITTCPPATQAALLRVVLDRMVGDVPLGPKVSVVAAANPPDIAAGGWDLAPPLLNRFFHLDWVIDHEVWCRGMIEGFSYSVPKLSNTWQMEVPQERKRVVGFIRRKPQALAQDVNKIGTSRAFATPRSWDMAARLIAAASTAGYEDMSLITEGTLGKSTGLEYLSWRKANDSLWDPEELLLNPRSAPGGLTKDKIASCGDAVVTCVLQRQTAERVQQSWHVIFNLWINNGKKLDLVIKPLTKLVVNSVVSITSCFDMKQAEHAAFVEIVRSSLKKWHGIDVK